MLHFAAGAAFTYAPVRKKLHALPVISVHLDSLEMVRPGPPPDLAHRKLPHAATVRPVVTERPALEPAATRLPQPEQAQAPQQSAEQRTAGQNRDREESGLVQEKSPPPARPLTSAGSGQTVPAPLITAVRQATNTVQQHYLQEHFAYIRDLLGKRLVYPPLARKMGWSGRTMVTFMILEDGSVEKIRVTESSGFALLDKSAVETVRTAAPFPRPPVRADITVPVKFTMGQ